MYSSEYQIDGVSFSFNLNLDNEEDATRFIETIKKESITLGFMKTREIVRKDNEIWYKYNIFVKVSKYSFSLFIKDNWNLSNFESQFKETVEKPERLVDTVYQDFLH